MLFTGAEISAMLGSYLWPFVRIAAMITAMPVFSSSFIPGKVRLSLAIGITMIVAPIVPPVPAIDALSLLGFFVVLNQMLIGIIMGFIFHLVFSAFVIGGQIIAMQMGLGFSTMIDPINGSQAPVLSMFYVLMITLFFVVLDGHLALIGLLAKSFITMPIGVGTINTADYWQMATWGSEMFKGAVLVSLPAVTALFLVNMALGIMGRAAPQLNIFAVGFTVTIIAGFYVLFASLPVILAQFELLMTAAFSVIKNIVGIF